MPREPDLSEFASLTEVEELRGTISRLQKQLRQAKARNVEMIEAVYAGARDAALALGCPPAVPRPAKRQGKGRPEVALLHLSDWQVGKATDTYNSTVAAERIALLGRKVAKLTAIERSDHPVKECHVLLGGDLCENVTIFPGQAWEVDASLFEQMFMARGTLAALIRDLLAIFDKVHCWEQTGNHGRLGRKGDHPRVDNADGLIYQMARDMLGLDEKTSRLVWHPRERWYTIAGIGNYQALLVHGDQIKSFGGTPAFAIMKRVNAWAAGVIPPFTDCYMGHFHNPLTLPLASGRGNIYVNASPESDNAFAAEIVAAAGRPAQRLHFVDPQQGRVTTPRLAWLDDDA